MEKDEIPENWIGLQPGRGGAATRVRGEGAAPHPLRDNDDFALKGGLEDLKPPAETPVGGGVLSDWLVQDYREASAVLRRRKAETLTEAAQVVVDERDAALAQLAAAKVPPAPSSPDVISWDSRGLRFRRYLENASTKLVRYAAKVGSVSFDLAVSQTHPERYDASLAVMLADGEEQHRTSYNLMTFRAMGVTIALAAEEAMRDCDIRLLTLARELTWGLK